MSNVIHMQEYLVKQARDSLNEMLSFITFVNLMREQGYSKKEAIDLYKKAKELKK